MEDLQFLARRGWLLFLAICSLDAASGEKIVKFNLLADEFPKAILEFYHQSKIEVLFLANDSLYNIRTQPVTGEFDPRVALERMLQGTGLTFEFDTDHSVIIKQPKIVASPPPPLAPPTKPAGHLARRPRVTESDGKVLSEIAEVLVTGSLIHTATDVQDPLISLTQSDFSLAPFETVQDTLGQLPIASLNVPREDLGINNNYNFGAGVNLRGLGVAATLVLVNGRRQPLSGLNGDFVDVSNIPAVAVDRVEILPVGASALYGSDAIAGVVNIILKDGFTGAETAVRFGGTPGGRDNVTVSQLLGTSWDQGKGMIAFEYADGSALPAAARGYSANSDKLPYGGADYRSYFSDPGNILDPMSFQPVSAVSDSPTINLENQFSRYQIFPTRQSESIYSTLSQKIGIVELFAEGRFTDRKTRDQRLPDDEALAVPATNPFNTFGVPVIVSYSTLQSFGPEVFGAETRNYFGTVGMRLTVFRDWRMSLSESYGGEKLSSDQYNYLGSTGLEAALASANPTTAFDAFGTPNSSATLASVQGSFTRHAASRIETTDLAADGTLFKLPAGDAKMGLGLERREESLEHTVGGLFSADVASTERYSRHVSSAFAELQLPLIGRASDNHQTPRVELDAAARYDNYSDFGQTVNPELRLQFAPVSWLRLRGSWGRSFRAPKLDDLYDSSNNASGEIALPDPKAASGQSTALVIQGDNPKLRPETAKTRTVGLDVVPTFDPGLKLSITYFAIDYEGQISSPAASDPFDVLVQENEWSAIITRNPTRAQIAAVCNRPDYNALRASCLSSSPGEIVDFRLANLSATNLTGLDLDTQQTFKSDFGLFDVGLRGSYFFHFDQAVTNGSQLVDIVDTFGNPLRLRLRATGAWHQRPKDGLSTAISFNFSNGYNNPGSTLAPRISSLTTTDLQISVDTTGDRGWVSGLQLSLNAVNIFNQSAPFADNMYGYDTANFQPLGRVLSFSVKKHW